MDTSTRPTPGLLRYFAPALLFIFFGSTLPAPSQTTPARQPQTSQPQSDNPGIATKTSAQAFESGSTRAAKGAEPGQPTAPKPSTAESILVLPKPLPAAITKGIDVKVRSKAILAHLSEVLRFYRMVIAPIQKVGEPSDMLYAEEAESQATQAAQLAFQGARDEAALLARVPNQSGEAQVPENLKRLNQVRVRAAQHIQELQQQAQSLDQQIAKARVSDRSALQQQLEDVKGQLELNEAMAEALAKVAGISATQGTTGLETQINQLQSAAPELANVKAKPVTHSIANMTSTREAGVVSLGTTLFQLITTEHAIDDRIAETQKLHDQAIELRTPLLNIMHSTMDVGQRMESQAASPGSSNLAETRKRYDELTDAFNAISEVSIPISQEVLLLDQVGSTLQTWRGSIDSERKTVLRSLMTRVVFIAIALIILFVVNEIARRATLRVQDVRRRRHLVLIRRMIVGFFTGLVLLFGFVTQFSSLATFAGFITAGIAVGLQTILLSVAAYFFIVGRYGVKVGDRITVSNVTGDVVDVGLARFYMMELTGTGTELHTTGRVAVFANSVLFQTGTPLYKQIPGTEYAWHELTVKIKPNTDYKPVTDTVLHAVNAVFDTYKGSIEQQHRQVEEWMDTPIQTPQIESRLQLSNGLEYVVLYPVEIRHAAATDEKVVQSVLDAINKNKAVADAVDGTPSVKAVVKG